MSQFPRQKTPKGSRSGQASNSSAKPDPRFAPLGSDPRYRLPSKKNTHVQLDERFGSILTDKDFAGHGGKRAGVDRYGRKVTKADASKNLRRFYRFDDQEEPKKDKEDDEVDDDDIVKKELLRARKYDPARDGGFSTSESNSDLDSDLDSDSDTSIHLGNSDLSEKTRSEDIEASLPADGATVPTGDVTSRLAVVNLDWDNVRAQDIFAVASSFLPSDGGNITNVVVYPSEFGRERMEREEVEGPPKDIFKSKKTTKSSQKQEVSTLEDSESVESEIESEEEDSEAEEERIKHELMKEDDGADFDSNALRKYQLERLRYYYAIITCSSVLVAKALYDSMDGQEYLSSANFFDLRFVPDEVDFDSDKPRDICKELPDGYKPEEFTTDALMHSNVKLRWDAEDNTRKEVQKRAFSRKEMEEEDLKAYIASASSEDEDEDEEEEEDDHEDGISTTSRATARQNRGDALRAAIGGLLDVSEKKKRNVGGMQVTFTPALSAKKSNGKVIEEIGETTAEMYVRKERERKARRRDKAKAKRHGGSAEGDSSEEEKDNDDMQDIVEDGFDDSFFNDEPKKSSSKTKKVHKSKVRFEMDEKDEEASRAKAELELIMAPDATSVESPTGNRFDMRSMLKAEKDSQKKQKKMSKNQKVLENEKTQESAVNLQDPRFASLYSDPAFAIDPTDHKFRDTKGMRSILDEKRRRTQEAMNDREGKRKRERPGMKSDVSELVESVRKKVKG